MAAMLVLVILNSAFLGRGSEEVPIIYRPTVDPLARQFVYCFAIAPALAGSFIAGLFDFDAVTGGAGIALLMSGLAVIVATGDLVHLRRQRLLRAVWALAVIVPAAIAIGTTMFQPWTSAAEVPTSLPGRQIARYFGDSFERRTNQPLRAVAGDPKIAGLIALDSGRPHLLLDATPQRTPWLNSRKIRRDRRHRGLARVGHRRHAARRYRKTLSGPRAGSPARLRVVCQRPPAAAADRLGHRAAEKSLRLRTGAAIGA